MYPVLYEAGFSNQPDATDRNDGLKLRDLYITAAVRCAPPDNKPLPQELGNCASFLDREMEGLRRAKVIVALGRIGFDAYLNYLKRRGDLERRKLYVFQHGAKYEMKNGKVLLPRYHPPNQIPKPENLPPKRFIKFFKKPRKLAENYGKRRPR